MAHVSAWGNPLGYQHTQAATPRGVLESFPRALSANPTYIQYLQKSAKRREQGHEAARHAPLSAYCQIQAQILELWSSGVLLEFSKPVSTAATQPCLKVTDRENSLSQQMFLGISSSSLPPFSALKEKCKNAGFGFISACKSSHKVCLSLC